MTKTLLSILIALVFVFGAAGVTMAAAQQSQPGEALYPLRAWSTQTLRQQEEAQIQVGHTGKMIQTRSNIHEQGAFTTPQSTATLAPCDQSVTNMQCGSGQDVGEIHPDDHPHQDHDRTNHQNDDADHRDGGTEQKNNGSDHENDGGEHDGDH